MYEHTRNLKHTIVNKGSMKALQRFIKIGMKENDCYLANWAWLKGRDNQDELATCHEIFQRNPSPCLNLARQNQVWMDVIQCCMMISWTYLVLSSFVLFASNLKWLVTKIPEGIITKGESSCCLPESACFSTEAHPWETFKSCFRLVRWSPL